MFLRIPISLCSNNLSCKNIFRDIMIEIIPHTLSTIKTAYLPSFWSVQLIQSLVMKRKKRSETQLLGINEKCESQ